MNLWGRLFNRGKKAPTPTRTDSDDSSTTRDTREAVLLTYWRTEALRWWEEHSGVHPVCDVCNRPVTKDDCYLLVVGRRVKCGSCTRRSLRKWAEAGWQRDYFGQGELSAAEKVSGAEGLGVFQPPATVRDSDAADELVEAATVAWKTVRSLPREFDDLRPLGIDTLVMALRWEDLASHSDTWLVRENRDGNWLTREALVYTLGELRDIRATEVLVASALFDSQWRVQEVASRALAKLPSESVVPLLVAKLSDERAWVRRRAVNLLAEVGGNETRNVLASVAAADTDPEVLRACSEGLARLSSRS